MFDVVKKRKVSLFISPVTVYEIEQSNEPRCSDMLKLLKVYTLFQETLEAEELAREYIKQKVLY